MTTRVFVPVADDMMENLDGRDTPLVPYHPDRLCWRFYAPAAEPSNRQAGSHQNQEQRTRDRRVPESKRLETRHQSPTTGRIT